MLEINNLGNKLSLIYLGWTCKYNVTACKTHIIYSVICIPFTKHVLIKSFIGEGLDLEIWKTCLGWLRWLIGL